MSKKVKGVKTPSRRKFFKAAAATGAAAAATVAMPNIALGAPVTLKMQAAWPSGANIFFEMAGDYAKMVSDMSGGELKIDLQPCLLYTSPSPRDATLSRMPSSA